MSPLSNYSLEQEVYRRDAVYRQPDWSYDTQTGRYRNTRNGRFLSEKDALKLTDKLVAKAQADLEQLMLNLSQGLIDLGAWERQFASLIKSVHLAQFILGKGGVKNTYPADFLKIARILKDEYRYLDGFAKDLAAGRLSYAQAVARAKLYLAKSRLSYWTGQQLAQQRGPMPSEMRRHLAPVEHCQECVIYSLAGWSPIGTLPLPTQDCSCRSNCKCTVEYR